VDDHAALAVNRTAPQLPAAYPGHPHASDEARQIAQDGLILLAEVGSGVHGIALPGTDDTDQMGVCLEPPQFITGLRRFEQYERHTAWDRPGGTGNRSGPGDLDVTVYGARKFCRLAADGNPSILTLLFTPPEARVYADGLAWRLLDHAPSFVSLQAADRYLGYLNGQRRGMVGVGRTNRPELVEKYGYDTKFASHAVRLAVQGIELLRWQRVILPMERDWREKILQIKRGEVWEVEVLALVAELERELQSLRQQNPWRIKEEPDREAIDRLLHRMYLAHWDRR
jgi:hypothetical protein